MTTAGSFLDLAGQISVALLIAGMALAIYRLVRGPSAADRVVAMDLLSAQVVAFLVTVSIVARETSYLDVAIAYACIAFLGTVALARYILRVSKRGDAPDD